MVDMFRNQREAELSQCQVSPVQNHSRDGAASHSTISTVGRGSADEAGPVIGVNRNVQRSPVEGTVAVSNAENVTSTPSMTDEGQTVASYHGKYIWLIVIFQLL